MSHKKRSLVKAITFRIIATIATIIIVLVLTGSLALAGTIGVADILAKTALYYFHERAWDKSPWGK